MKLAGEIVGQFHGADAVRDARAHFENVFSQKQVPDDIQVVPLAQLVQESAGLVDILVKAAAVPSKNEARRLIKQGAISFNGQPVADEGWIPAPGVLKIGKRRFLKLQ